MSRSRLGSGVCLLLLLSAFGPSVPGCTPPRPENGSLSPVAPSVDTTAPLADAGDVPLHIHTAITPEERERYTGSSKCVSCHAEQAGQLETHHAETLSVADASHAARFSRGGDRVDSAFGVTYRTRYQDGACVLEARSGEKVGSARADFAFGSGGRGVTYLGRYGETPVELRLSYYSRAGMWDFTPGQQVGARVTTPVGRKVDQTTVDGCFRCHTTAFVKRDEGVDVERSLLGVGCESCHGPGRDHVEAVRAKAKDLKMLRLADHRDRVSTELCGQCHRTASSANVGGSDTAAHLPRFQGLALANSACFRKSEGRLSCVTCHDPHRDADRTTRVEYNSACVSCHARAKPTDTACPKQPRGDCVSCHMPEQTVDMPTSPRFRTHWIKVWSRMSAGPVKRGPAAGVRAEGG